MNRHADEDRIAGELSAIPGLTRGRGEGQRHRHRALARVAARRRHGDCVRRRGGEPRLESGGRAIFTGFEAVGAADEHRRGRQHRRTVRIGRAGPRLAGAAVIGEAEPHLDLLALVGGTRV